MNTRIKMIDLKEVKINPCQDCGGKPGLLYETLLGGGYFRVLCTYCHKDEGGFGVTEQEAIDNWNIQNPPKEEK